MIRNSILLPWPSQKLLFFLLRFLSKTYQQRQMQDFLGFFRSRYDYLVAVSKTTHPERISSRFMHVCVAILL